MSTTGKVLSVLAVLLALVWTVLTSAVAELNRNGTKAFEDLQGKYSKIAEDLKVAEHDFQTFQDKINEEQIETDNDLAVLRGQQAELEKARSQVLEITSRLNLDLELLAVTIKQATVDRDFRATEKVAEIKAKADAEAEVEKLKSENADSLARLTELRETFKSALEANKSMVEKLESKSGTTAPVARRTSLSR